MFRNVDYMGVQDAVSAHPAVRNVGTSVPRLSVNEVIYGDRLSGIC